VHRGQPGQAHTLLICSMELHEQLPTVSVVIEFYLFMCRTHVFRLMLKSELFKFIDSICVVLLLICLRRGSTVEARFLGVGGR
jgi:hypothetical protein